MYPGWLPLLGGQSVPEGNRKGPCQYYLAASWGGDVA